MASVDKPTSGKCKVCGVSAVTKCSWCHLVAYCSKEHQREDWTNHKSICILYEIKEDPVIGKYLAAKLPIKRGELVIKEKPVVIGPVDNSGSVCLGCHNRIELASCHPCSKCGWPLCSEACEASPHHKPECLWTLEKRQKKVQINELIDFVCVTILRILYLSKESPDEWAKVSALESHCAKRRIEGLHEAKWRSLAHFLRNYMGLKEFSVDEIVRVCGIFQINPHQVPLSTPGYAGLHVISSMFEHNCNPNCSISYSDEGEILVWANVKVKKGEHLSIAYTNILWNTLQRWYHMRLTKYFSCTCQRCSSPSEFGTNFSAVSCPSLTCRGVVLPETFLQERQIWKCTTCSKLVPMSSVLAVLSEIDMIKGAMIKGSLGSVLHCFNQLKAKVPSNFATLVEVKFTLATMLGRGDDGLGALDMETLLLKETLCREFLEIANILLRSSCRQMGIIHHELHTTLFEKACRLALLSPPSCQVALFKESRAHLEESIFYLKYEPQAMAEGRVCKNARSKLKCLNELCNRLDNIAPNVP